LNRGGNNFDLQDVAEDIRKHARRGETITYGDLMRRFHISRGRTHGIAEVLWRISEREACRLGASHDPPHFISAVVVRAATGYPSGGFFGLAGIPADLERAERSYADHLLSAQEKRYVEKVWNHLRRCPERGSNDGGRVARSDSGQT